MGTSPTPAQERAAAVGAVMSALSHVSCSRVLGALVRRRIADHLADRGPLGSGELASLVGLHPLSLQRALRLCAGFGMFQEVSPGVFANNAASELLMDRAEGLRNAVWYMTSDVIWQMNGGVDHSLVTGESTFFKNTGQTQWEFNRSHPEYGAAFDLLLAELRGGEYQAVAKAYDWSDVNTVADVGGGTGSLLAAILSAQPHVHGILLEQAETISAARSQLTERGLQERCEFLITDFFGSYSAAANIWLLAQVLHDWPDADCRRILSRCRANMRSTDRLLVIEMVTIPCQPNLRTALSDISMLALFGEGRQRTPDEYRDLFAECGLALDRMISTASPFSIVEARPIVA